MNTVRRILSTGFLSLVVLIAAAADDSTSPNTEIWRKVRADLFGDRPITDDAGTGKIVLQLPARAADAAVVPLAIRIKSSPNDALTKKLYVVIDRNPSPIAGIFEFGEGSGSPELETRVRIEEYTWVRVIAERANASSRRPAAVRRLPASHWLSVWPGWGR
jgi:sulfur-oxidizing protein SoxY